MAKIETNLGYDEINLETVPFAKDFDTIIHIINPTEILSILDSLKINIQQTDLGIKSNILILQLNFIKNKMYTLIPHRQKRGLFNFVGTMHKWLYGTMSNDDREEIEQIIKIEN